MLHLDCFPVCKYCPSSGKHNKNLQDRLKFFHSPLQLLLCLFFPRSHTWSSFQSSSRCPHLTPFFPQSRIEATPSLHSPPDCDQQAVGRTQVSLREGGINLKIQDSRERQEDRKIETAVHPGFPRPETRLKL